MTDSTPNFFRYVTQFFNRFPQMVYGWFGLTYNPTDATDPTKFVFWWREICHFLGGFFLGLVIPFYGIFLMILMKESIENWSLTKKSWIDISAWSFGAAIGNGIVFVLWKILF